MKRFFSLLMLSVTLLIAKADFSEMSTEELIALIGYVDAEKEEPFYRELEKRVSQMDETQKTLYEKDQSQRRKDAQSQTPTP
ncbi:DUF1104 domain-containing protein [Sulfurospirillum sp. hDNRA2]|jgi:hypothetical protein|uniref:DUF1104 domain-containing protein n=1 Tax=Sulfurospirillum sp. hDNRA2 TaxID=3237298 RepID=UPI0020B86674|nr:DUF1104 domain-containing protein [Sulfurospirillum sp. DNRA8]MCP3652419.1 DUF1104 domain-containing protein [Sulfurospirillum sp. DNRA8]MCR1811270.1 DUF1104 domain-containing protein [Sulfurospirillum sp. DNRA8]